MNRLKQYDTILCENKAQWEHIKKHVRLYRSYDDSDTFENYSSMYWGKNGLMIGGWIFKPKKKKKNLDK